MEAESASHEADVVTRPKWRHQTKISHSGGWALVDHPELWKKCGIREDLLRNNRRLKRLGSLPKNEIVSLPNAGDVIRHFYCSSCSGIPFPWTGGSPTEASSKDAPDAPVLLCERGHALCRTCYHSLSKCVFTLADFNYVFAQTIKPQEIQALLAYHMPKSIPGSLSSWGRIPMCLADRSAFTCGFLTSMINGAEFACKYYYNWCAFRGSGSELLNHESKCPHGPSTTTFSSKVKDASRRNEDEDSPESGNDSEILKVDVDVMRRDIQQQRQSMTNEYE